MSKRIPACGSTSESHRTAKCKECSRVWNRAYYLRNAERLKASQRKYNAEQSEEISRKRRARRATDPEWRDRDRARSKAWGKANAERKAAHGKAWHETNREHANELAKAWQRANPDRQRELRRLWRERNPEKAAALSRTYRKSRRARRRDQFVEHVDADVCYQMHGGRCGICGQFIDLNVGAFHVDHVVPLAKGGEHSYANTQPSHPECNWQKHDKLNYTLEVS